jgi:hypothetical protein
MPTKPYTFPRHPARVYQEGKHQEHRVADRRCPLLRGSSLQPRTRGLQGFRALLGFVDGPLHAWAFGLHQEVPAGCPRSAASCHPRSVSPSGDAA